MTGQSQTTPPKAPYGRHGNTGPAAGAGLGSYNGQTYYDRPALKPGHYRWLIATYLWVGGMAGAAQVLAVVADFAGSPQDRVVVRVGRYLALLGAVIGPVLLILDLHRPGRFYNMLRIFRRTSPMSFGSWVLAAFGTFSGLAVATQLAEDYLRWEWAVTLGRIVGIPAALSGVAMAYYTASLLSATSVPFWAAAPRHLAALFAASSVSLAAAAIILGSKLTSAAEEVVTRLEMIDLIAASMELLLLVSADRQWRRWKVAGPLRRMPLAPVYFLGVMAAGLLLPIILYVVQFSRADSSPAISMTAALAGLAGGFLLRTVVLFAGRHSAQNPREYFEFTQPAGRESLSHGDPDDRSNP